MFEAVKRIASLETLTEDQWLLLEPYSEKKSLEAYTDIIKQGETNRYLYLILQGEVERIKGRPLPASFGRLHQGDWFGEVSCLTGREAPSTIRAVTPVELWQLSKEGFQLLMDLNKEVRNGIVSMFAQRIRGALLEMEAAQIRSDLLSGEMEKNDARLYGELLGESEAITKLRRQIPELAYHMEPVCIVGEEGVGKRHVAAQIHYEGDRRGPLLFVNGTEAMVEDLRKHCIAAAGGTLVIYHAEKLREEHVEMLRQNRQVRWIVLSEQPVEFGPIQTLYVPPLRERTIDIPILVRFFLQRSGIRKPMEAISNEAMRLLMMYPYMEANVEELEQVIRAAVVMSAGQQIRPEHLTWGVKRQVKREGRLKVGLALGSGTVRGTAHLGVLKVLEEAGIPIDIVTGTSAGALVGGLYAAGMSIEEMIQKLPQMSWSQIARPVMSGRALFSNEPLGKWLRKQLGPKAIENCALPFAAVAADETTGEAVVFQKGPLDLAVQASTAIPSMMHPIAYKGKQLIDGAVVHRVPVMLARSMGADIVIGVDVEVPVQAVRPPKYVWNTFLRTYYIMSEKLAQEELHLADVVIKPKMSSNVYRFKYAPEFLNQGEAAARHALPAIRALINDDRH